MKILRATAVLLLVAFCLNICGCDERNENSSSPSQVSQTVSETEELTLEDVVCSEGFTLYGIHTEVSVHYNTSDNQYDEMNFYFDNRNESFILELKKFLSIELSQPIGGYDYNSDRIYISLDSEEGFCSFLVTADDHISVDYGTYYCQGVYNKLKDFIDPFVDHNFDYYHTACTPVLKNFEFTIMDINGKCIDSGCIPEEPNIFASNSTVRMWIQWGTGPSTCTNTYYDIFTGQKSPEYLGLSDYYGSIVLSTVRKFAELSDGVYFYDMFSGKLLYTIDEFDFPLCDSVESIVSAYFSPDGKTVVVEYYTESNDNLKMVTQIFDLPQKVIDKQ